MVYRLQANISHVGPTPRRYHRWRTTHLPIMLIDSSQMHPTRFSINIRFTVSPCSIACMRVGPIVWVKKSPPPERSDILSFFHKWLRIFNRFLHTYYTFLYTLDHKFLFNYLQIWWRYAVLSATTQFTQYAQNVHHRPKRMRWHVHVCVTRW